jgi:hypothetical protein
MLAARFAESDMGVPFDRSRGAFALAILED